MKKTFFAVGCFMACLGMPFFVQAQTGALASGIAGMQGVLQQLYTTMLPMCSQLIGVGQGLAGLAALGYIGVRVGERIAAAEPVDVFPLLRPLVIGTLIMLYPYFIAGINGVLQPTVDGTSAMVTTANASIASLLQQKQAAVEGTTSYQLYAGPDGSGNQTMWELYTGNVPTDALSNITTAFGFQLSKAFFNLKNTIKVWLSEILEVIYEAAALCVNAVRTFNMIVLAILGPLVLGLSVFDVFRHTLGAWLARYVQVFLWLPVANIFGAIIATIQTQMIQLDIQQIQSNGSTYFSSTDIAYLIFLIIGIVGYMRVPSVAGYIVQAGGGDALANKTTSVVKTVVQGAVKLGAAAAAAL